MKFLGFDIFFVDQCYYTNMSIYETNWSLNQQKWHKLVNTIRNKFIFKSTQTVRTCQFVQLVGLKSIKILQTCQFMLWIALESTKNYTNLPNIHHKLILKSHKLVNIILNHFILNQQKLHALVNLRNDSTLNQQILYKHVHTTQVHL